MNVLEAAANPLFSTIAGGLSGIITGVLGFFQKREDNKFALLRMDKERELLGLTANIEAAKAAGALALAREAGASSAFTASVEADGRIAGEHKWATTVRSLIRPGLVIYSQLAATGILAVCVYAWFNKLCADYDVIPLIQYIVISIVNLSAMSASWYFGQRQMDKVAVAWGNKTVNASYSPTAPAAPVAPKAPTK